MDDHKTTEAPELRNPRQSNAQHRTVVLNLLREKPHTYRGLIDASGLDPIAVEDALRVLRNNFIVDATSTEVGRRRVMLYSYRKGE